MVMKIAQGVERAGGGEGKMKIMRGLKRKEERKSED